MPRGMHSAGPARRPLIAGLAATGLVAALSACTGSPVQPAAASSTLALSTRSGALRGGTAVVATGSALAGVRSVTVGGIHATVSASTTGRVEFRTPAAARFAAGSVPVVLRGDRDARATWTYRAVDGVDRQLAYLLRYWERYNPAWQALSDDDCVDFTSQALLQRGWRQQDDWFAAADVLESGIAWRGSTAFMTFMQEHPALGTALTDAERSRVKVGDVVQFDWDRSGDRDHTGTVTRVERTGSTWQVFFAGHTDDSDFRSVDTAITKDHPGGAAYYWSLA